MEITMIRVNIVKDKEATISRFLKGIKLEHYQYCWATILYKVRGHDSYGYKSKGTT